MGSMTFTSGKTAGLWRGFARTEVSAVCDSRWLQLLQSSMKESLRHCMGEERRDPSTARCCASLHSAPLKMTGLGGRDFLTLSIAGCPTLRGFRRVGFHESLELHF